MIDIKIKKTRSDDDYINYEAEIQSCKVEVQFRADTKMPLGVIEDIIKSKIIDRLNIVMEE